MILHGVPIYIRADLPPVEAVGIANGYVVAAGALAAVQAALVPTLTARSATWSRGELVYERG
jgi:hypothetical protein